MKFGKKIQFGVQAVVAGQKSATVNALPQLIANSTTGKFTITSPVSKALNIAVGENVMFLNNIAGVEAAISARVDDVVAFAAENNYDLDTREGVDAVLAAFTCWFIAKGEKLYTSKGEPQYVSARFTKEDKQKYLDAHADEIVAANRDALVEMSGNPDATDEELKALLNVDMVEVPKVHSVSGSKTATSGSATGVGCQLSFTDTSIWNTLKSDLEDKGAKNRVFNVLLDEAQQVEYNNGYENKTITIYPIEFEEDADRIVRESSEA